MQTTASPIIERDFATTLKARLHEPLNFIQVVLGPRQVGKTTAIEQIIKQWHSSWIYETADTLSAPDPSWIELHWRRARELSQPVLLVFDEVQKIVGWSERIKVLFDQDRKKRTIRVVLLGSASLSLQQGLTESLAGRYEILRAYHWNFIENRKAFGWDINHFLQFGGYPGGAELASDEKRWQDFMRFSILEPVLSRDLLGLTSISKPALFRQTFELCLRYPAQELSLNKILGSLQDKGNVTTIRHYLDLLEGAFLLKTVPKYSGSIRSSKSSIPKLLPLAPALVHAFTSPSRIVSDNDWRGRVFELAVGAQLAQLTGDLFYWRDKFHELDYVFIEDGELFAIEVKSGRTDKRKHGLNLFVEQYAKAIPVLISPETFEKFASSPNLKSFVRQS